MFKNEKKIPVDNRRITVSEKVISLSDLLKPNAFRNNLNNNTNNDNKPTRAPFIRQIVKTDKLNYDKIQGKLKTICSLKNDEKEEFGSDKGSSKTGKVLSIIITSG
jgi:hypothetical protein